MMREKSGVAYGSTEPAKAVYKRSWSEKLSLKGGRKSGNTKKAFAAGECQCVIFGRFAARYARHRLSPRFG